MPAKPPRQAARHREGAVAPQEGVESAPCEQNASHRMRYPVAPLRMRHATQVAPWLAVCRRSKVVSMVSHTLTVCFDATSLVVGSYGYDDGRIGPTRCAMCDKKSLE